jgi:hypothetical protein
MKHFKSFTAHLQKAPQVIGFYLKPYSLRKDAKGSQNGKEGKLFKS